VYRDPKLGLRDTTPFYRFLQKNISKLWGPSGQNIGVRAVLGGWDPTAKDSVIHQWLTALPQLQGHIQMFRNVGHFIEEFKPNAIAQAIIELSDLK
jgi:hypothetical protein